MESNITTSADDSSRTATNRRQPSACSAACEISASRWRSRLHDDGVTERATFTSFSLELSRPALKTRHAHGSDIAKTHEPHLAKTALKAIDTVGCQVRLFGRRHLDQHEPLFSRSDGQTVVERDDFER